MSTIENARPQRFDFLSCAFGGGRNGAYLLGLYERNITPNLITFADTGHRDAEKPETYEAIDRLAAWCEAHFGISVTWVRKTSMYSSLYDNCIRTGTLPSIAYGWRSCSDKWKIQPQDKFHNNDEAVRAVWAAGKKVTKIIGYHAGEPQRARLYESAKYVWWYPLIEWGWDTELCIEAFRRHGLPIPVKSACYFCPASTKKEVLALSRNHPELFALAVQMERNAAPNLKTVKGLGRHWSWESLVQIDSQQISLLPEAPEVPCGCFDGDAA